MRMALEQSRDLLRPLFAGKGADAVDEHAAGVEASDGLVEKIDLDLDEGVDVGRGAAPAGLRVAANHAEAGAGGVDEDEVEVPVGLGELRERGLSERDGGAEAEV